MKYIIPILILSFLSCKKQVIEQSQNSVSNSTTTTSTQTNENNSHELEHTLSLISNPIVPHDWCNNLYNTKWEAIFKLDTNMIVDSIYHSYTWRDTSWFTTDSLQFQFDSSYFPHQVIKPVFKIANSIIPQSNIWGGFYSFDCKSDYINAGFFSCGIWIGHSKVIHQDNNYLILQPNGAGSNFDPLNNAYAQPKGGFIIFKRI